MTALANILERIEKQRKAEVDLWRPAPVTDKTVERRVKKLNKKAVEAAPLFAYAGMVELVTSEQVEENLNQRNDAYCKQMIASSNAMAECAVMLLFELSNLQPDSWLAEMEAYRVRVLPPSLEYDCDFWRKKLKEINQ